MRYFSWLAAAVVSGEGSNSPKRVSFDNPPRPGPGWNHRGYRRFRCRDCGRQFNERSAGVLNRAQYPSDVIALAVLGRLRHRLTLRDLSEMFLLRGIVFSHEAERDWEARAR